MRFMKWNQLHHCKEIKCLIFWLISVKSTISSKMENFQNIKLEYFHYPCFCSCISALNYVVDNCRDLSNNNLHCDCFLYYTLSFIKMKVDGGECSNHVPTAGVLLNWGSKNDPNYLETVDPSLFQCCNYFLFIYFWNSLIIKSRIAIVVTPLKFMSDQLCTKSHTNQKAI